MTTLRRSSAPPPALHWDGSQLLGTTPAKSVRVTVPLRLVALRRDRLPPAPLPARRAAARMKAERAFAVLGPVAIEALLYPVRDGQATVLLLALPELVLAAIRQAVQAQGKSLAGVGIAEFQRAIPVGGVVDIPGEQTLVALEHGEIQAVATLSGSEPERTLARERRRLGVAENAPGAEAQGQDCDFLTPTLTAVPGLWVRPEVRAGALVAGLLLALGLAGFLSVLDALNAQQAAHADAERLRPLGTLLAAERADTKAVAGWFGERPAMAMGLAVLAAALPAPGNDDQVRLVRVRQIPGEPSLAEGLAGDRAQMLGFLTRLRQDPRIAAADIRTFRTPTKGSSEVSFELTFRLKGDAPSSSAAAAPVPMQGAAHADA